MCEFNGPTIYLPRSLGKFALTLPEADTYSAITFRRVKKDGKEFTSGTAMSPAVCSKSLSNRVNINLFHQDVVNTAEVQRNLLSLLWLVKYVLEILGP